MIDRQKQALKELKEWMLNTTLTLSLTSGAILTAYQKDKKRDYPREEAGSGYCYQFLSFLW